MKKTVLVLALLSTLTAQALQTLNVVCDSSEMSSEMNRFNATAEFTVDSAGSATGQIFLSGRSVFAKGKIISFAPGEMMKGESHILELESEESFMSIFVNGPPASSRIEMKRGLALFSTCKEKN
jgi:hypothetical protein